MKLRPLQTIKPAPARFGTITAFDMRNATEQRVHLNPMQVKPLHLSLDEADRVPALDWLRAMMATQKLGMAGQNTDRVVLSIEPIQPDGLKLKSMLQRPIQKKEKEGPGLVLKSDYADPKDLVQFIGQFQQWQKQLMQQAQAFFD